MWKLLCVLPLLFVGNLQAQICVPDTSLANGENGVFPMPYHEESNPEGGITKEACLNSYYEFVLTTVVGDSFRLGDISQPMDSLTISPKDAVSGLPDGLSYRCDPPTCCFKPRTQGCVLISGTPTNKDQVGEHELVIKGTLYIKGFGGYALVFPSQLIAPGNYTLKVNEEGSAACATAIETKSIEDHIQRSNHSISLIQGDGMLNLYSLDGSLIRSGRRSISTSELQHGLYVLLLSDQKQGLYRGLIRL